MTEETITYTRKKKKARSEITVLEAVPEAGVMETKIVSKEKAPKRPMSDKQKANIERLIQMNKEKREAKLLTKDADDKAKAEALAKAKEEAEAKEMQELKAKGLRKVKYIIKPRKKREAKHVEPKKEEAKHVEQKPKVSFEAKHMENQKDYLDKDDYDYPSESDEDESDIIPSDTTDTKQIKRKVQKIKQLESALAETKSNPYNDLLKKYY